MTNYPHSFAIVKYLEMTSIHFIISLHIVLCLFSLLINSIVATGEYFHIVAHRANPAEQIAKPLNLFLNGIAATSFVFLILALAAAINYFHLGDDYIGHYFLIQLPVVAICLNIGFLFWTHFHSD